MKSNIAYILLIFVVLIACKSEHPDLKAAFDMYKDAQSIKQSIITNSASLKNDAKLVDNRIRNEDKESVFAISEVYNHLEFAETAFAKMNGKEHAVPGHEKECSGALPVDSKTAPAIALMMQKNFRDSLISIKNDVDAAATLLNQLKVKFH